MAVSLTRNHRREKIFLNCSFISPAFLGGADQQANLSVAPLKAALRYWWRVSGVHQIRDTEDMFKKESKIFGSTEESSGKSKIFVSISRTDLQIQKASSEIPQCSSIRHPEVPQPVNALAYLGGMGIWEWQRSQRKFLAKRSYFSVGSFEVIISFPETEISQLSPALRLFKKFGTLGSRSRNAFGSVTVKSEKIILTESIQLQEWKDLFRFDYPNGLGADKSGLLAWQSKRIFEKWEDAMHLLAESYVSLRTKSNPLFAFPTESTPHRNPLNRHLLGYPITKHNVEMRGWGKNGRHASGLRFALKPDLKDPSKLRIIALHVPHAFAKEMMSERNGWPVTKQQDIWAEVHRSFDQNINFERLNPED